MKHRTFVRPEAQSDIREAARWYEARESGLGLRFLGEVGTALNHIKSNPGAFPMIEENVRRALLHKFPYSIYFVNEAEATAVIAVVHQHRRPGIWKSRT
ncbi:MAG TPA: type II toxin-antitoxin system RelE/ParE family toxin [Pyrinomonadaceae bacterium]|nr:type II toxin-antitoxin system RelE/ParE family toxin [Pyrinomonadaceae bacterium]